MTTTKPVPICTQTLLHRHLDYTPHKKSKFPYRYVIGKLKYLDQCTWPEILYVVHQCAHFSSNPQKDHTNVVNYIYLYLKWTSDLGLSFKTYIYMVFECFSDAACCGNWSCSLAKTDLSTSKSRPGWCTESRVHFYHYGWVHPSIISAPQCHPYHATNELAKGLCIWLNQYQSNCLLEVIRR